jgi:hypothetical protein
MMLVAVADAGGGVAAADAHAHRPGDPGALTHPEMVQALGHNVPRVFMLVFGAGCALAGLAGVIGGSTFVTEPAMAATVGSIIFVVVVVGGMGSLAGAFIASLLIGVIQTFAVALDWSLGSAAARMGIALARRCRLLALKLTISQVAPILPYLFLVLILIFRPKGLLGTREGDDVTADRTPQRGRWIIWGSFALAADRGALVFSQQPGRPCCRRWASPSSPACPTTCCWGRAAC